MKAYVLLAVLVLASIIPFASRAVFIDEHIFLRIARSALSNPFFPADTPLLFFGMERANYAGHTHPPVGEYYLAALYRLLGGFDEVTFRLLFAVFPVIAILAFYVLARRFTREPFMVAVVLAVSPAFFVLAPTLMMDIPMLAFLLAGLAFYFHQRLILAALSFILATGTGYTALVPIGCLGLLMLVARRPFRELACVLAAPAALALWLGAMTVHFGQFPLTQTAEYLIEGVAPKSGTQLIKDRASTTLLNGMAILSFLGGVSVFPGSIRLRKPRSWIACLGLVSALSFCAPMPSILFRIGFVVLATCGVMIVAALVDSAARTVQPGSRNTGEAVLILWVPAVLVFFVAVADMINARYILLVLPPLYLMLFRESSRAQLMATVIPTAVLSLVLAYADSRFVNSYRTWVENTIPALQEEGFHTYSASESGLRFYLESNGVPTLSQTDLRPTGGDNIVRQSMFPYGLTENLEVVLTPLRRFSLEDWFPIRTFNKAAHAGFYDSNIGLVPFTFSSAPHDEIQITQVNPLVQKLPQPSTNPELAPVWSADGPIFRQSLPERVFPMRFPSNIEIQYELEGGTGFAEATAQGLRLVNSSGKTLTWRRLRFMPLRLMESGH